MPNELNQYFIPEPYPVLCSISLTLTNTITHPGDPTSQINVSLLIDEGIVVSEPQLEVSLTHA